MTGPAPVGGDSWVDYIDQQLREATDLEARVNVIEQFRRAVSAEPGCIKVWMAYCEYFWSLHSDCQPGSDAGWSQEDQMIGRETFSLDAALNLWQEGYEAVRYRLNDSHELWNRWISLEMELLAKTRTEQGVRRITHLFKDRLTIPHATWENTSQMFSSFLSEYNRQAYEAEMLQVTENARDAKRRYEPRDPFEMKLAVATRSGNPDEQKTLLSQYLDWEMRECRVNRDDIVSLEICLALYSRALTGIYAADETTWINYIVFISSTHSEIKSGRVKNPNMAQAVPNMLDSLQRAVHHIPWSGTAWARYILSGEEAGLSFSDMERIKHAATSSSQLDRDGMSGVLEMYAAWCGYLKRTAMDTNASEEAVDLADIGLPVALEDVQHWGKRRYGDAYQGDPNCRLEKIYIQYLTEKKDCPEDARVLWERLSHNDLYANSYDFWLSYYLWEMVVFSSAKSKARSPTPSMTAQGLRVPNLATQIFIRALRQKTLDWPERVMDVYLQHCNDYEQTDTLRQALDTVYKTKRIVNKRREREAAAAQAAYAAVPTHPGQQAQSQTMTDGSQGSPSGGKRKREGSLAEEGENANKRARSDMVNGTELPMDDQEQQTLKRDRENTSVFVSNLPAEATQTKVRQYFREYGHINNISFVKNDRDIVALVEFRSPEEAQSALLRDGKYFGQQQITVRAATGCTLFVTNYPPEADERYIRGLFNGCGEVFSVRFPSLKYNTKRRFCYVTFYNSEVAAEATKLNGKVLDSKFKLLAKYSDPQGKQQRSGAQAEGREIHVLNLAPDTKEEELETVFAKHGTVKSARIIRNMAGQSHGSAFVAMETKEQAQEAIKELDKIAFRGRVLTIELSKPKNFKTTATSRGTPGPSMSPSPAPSGPDAEGDESMQDGASGSTQGRQSRPAEIAARTIAVLGIPDTVNDARVRAVLEPIGEIVKLVLHATHGGAVVEFADVATAGKAALAIEGTEIEPGKKLRVGSVADMFKAKAETRIDRIDHPAPSGTKGSGGSGRPASALMPPPPTVRRPPVLGGRGGRGGKRGLGFTGSAAKKTTEAPATNRGVAAKANGAAPAAAKSNADFKALFLGGGGRKGQGGTEG
ncbi:hypothetical protein QBC33DRAFT_460418 [Phialemonium atrogriseum]|uniref:U4/U6 snRNA-associated-splicing factor PRP24 n=1 Tax=Phialemonium atrogriseum TaxID=1093897 RepID=A0AAJ0BR00_9PEZI|nr:uncharacterized protein QBC33DRAFT_460418 [Phialemonium atrogriseum]KAK1762875.1 hypothetical protein QBC33DRAFT_460418 [Phialemonium atrogriseum]